MKPTNETAPEVDVRVSQPVPAGEICKCICRAVHVGGSVVAIVPAGFMQKQGVVAPGQPQQVMDVYRVFWIEPHQKDNEGPPRMPGNGELRISEDDV